MSKPFLITGLPRSRTAWMAAFFSTSPAICHHEPLKLLWDITELPTALASSYHRYVGASDSGAGYFLPWIMRHMNPPTVIIDRNIADVQESMRAIGFDVDGALELLAKRVLTFKEHPSVLWVPFDSLSKKRTMERIWFHLLPGVPFDEERFELFNELRIEADVDAIKRLSVTQRDRQQHLLRDVFKELKSCRG